MVVTLIYLLVLTSWDCVRVTLGLIVSCVVTGRHFTIISWWNGREQTSRRTEWEHRFTGHGIEMTFLCIFNVSIDRFSRVLLNIYALPSALSLREAESFYGVTVDQNVWSWWEEQVQIIISFYAAEYAAAGVVTFKVLTFFENNCEFCCVFWLEISICYGLAKLQRDL